MNFAHVFFLFLVLPAIAGFLLTSLVDTEMIWRLAVAGGCAGWGAVLSFLLLQRIPGKTVVLNRRGTIERIFSKPGFIWSRNAWKMFSYEKKYLYSPYCFPVEIGGEEYTFVFEAELETREDPSLVYDFLKKKNMLGDADHYILWSVGDLQELFEKFKEKAVPIIKHYNGMGFCTPNDFKKSKSFSYAIETNFLKAVLISNPLLRAKSWEFKGIQFQKLGNTLC